MTKHPPVKPGNIYGLLTVITLSHRDSKGRAYYHCVCSCGGEHYALGDTLKSGQTKFCKAGHHVTWTTKHGHHRNSRASAEYQAWIDMRRRCNDPLHPAYKNYGARGIRVCDEWQDSFESFIAHVGNKPSPDLSIDRINNDGNYEPGNVKWATALQQTRNRRKRTTVKTLLDQFL